MEKSKRQTDTGMTKGNYQEEEVLMKITGQVPGETKEISVKVGKKPRTTINIPCTLIKEEPRNITMTLHVEKVKAPVFPKTVRVRTIREPKKTMTLHVEEIKEEPKAPMTVRVVDVKKDFASPRAEKKN